MANLRNFQEMSSPRIILRNWQLQRLRLFHVELRHIYVTPEKIILGEFFCVFDYANCRNHPGNNSTGFFFAQATFVKGGRKVPFSPAFAARLLACPFLTQAQGCKRQNVAQARDLDPLIYRQKNCKKLAEDLPPRSTKTFRCQFSKLIYYHGSGNDCTINSPTIAYV